MNFVKKVRLATLWGKAKDCAARADNPGALRAVKKIYEQLGELPPSRKVDPVINLFCASVADGTDRELVINASALVVDQVTKTTEGVTQFRSAKKYTPDETAYLAYYAKILLETALSGSHDPRAAPSRMVDVGFKKIDLKNVRRRTKTIFPISTEMARYWDYVFDMLCRGESVRFD